MITTFVHISDFFADSWPSSVTSLEPLGVIASADGVRPPAQREASVRGALLAFLFCG